MRKLVLASTFMVLQVTLLHAQDWNLFPIDNHIYYSAGDMIYTVTPDSSSALGDTTVTFLQRSDTPLSVNGCTDEIEAYTLPPGTSILFPYIEKLVNVNGNTTLVFGVDAWDIHFNTKLPEGDTFHLGGLGDPDLYVKCTDIRIEAVFGVDDSVREYTIYRDGGTTDLTDQKILLSKTFGLIAFWDLYLLSYYEEGYSITFYDLVGFDGINGTKGFKPPFWKDYFPLHVGDVLIWDYHSIFNMLPYFEDFHFYYKDSVIARMDYPDSIVFYYDRWKKDTLNIISAMPTFRLSFKRNDQIVLFEGPTGRYKQAEYKSGFFYFNADVVKSSGIKMIYSGDDTIYSYVNTGGYYVISNDDCLVEEMYDVGFSYSVQTDHGFVGTGYSVGDGSVYVALVGGNINGEAFGLDDFETVDINNAASSTFVIFPNPTIDAVNIQMPENLQGDIRIYNAAGSCITYMKNGTGKITFNTSNWPSGIYLVQVISEAGSAAQRLVKW